MSGVVRPEAMSSPERGTDPRSIDGCPRVAENEAAVEKIRAGKAQAIGAIVGAVMRETKGRADGGEVNRLLREQLGV